MKILITGSMGRIASKIIPMMHPRYQLKLTDLKEGEFFGRPVAKLDITDYAAVEAASEGMDAVLHLAITSERDLITDRQPFRRDEGNEYLQFNQTSIDTNIRGTYHIFEAARKNRVARVVYGSSLTVYLGQPTYDATHDDLWPRPVNFYGVTKLCGEQFGEYFSRKHKLRVYCLRFGTPFPIIGKSTREQWLEIPVGRRTFVTYEDIHRAIMAALISDGPAYGAYSIVSATPGCAFDVSKAAEIDWSPQDFIAEDGTISPIPCAPLSPAFAGREDRPDTAGLPLARSL